MPDVKPKNGTGRPSAGGTPRRSPSKTSTKSQIQSALTEQTAAVAMMLALKGDAYPSLVMEHVGPQWAENMATLAESSPAVKRILTLATQGGVTGAAILSTAVMVLPMLAYYGIAPESMRDQLAGIPISFGGAPEEALASAWYAKHGDPEAAPEDPGV